MGNQGNYWRLCCWKNGRSPSARQTDPNPSRVSGSGPNPLPQQVPETTPQDSTANLLQQANPNPSLGSGSGSGPLPHGQQGSQTSQLDSFADLLQKIVKEGIKLEKFLEYIDKVLSKHRDGQHVTVEMANLEDGEKALDGIVLRCEKLQSKRNDIVPEMRKVLGEVLEKVGNLDWITLGFAMLAVGVRRLDKTLENKESCLDILESLQVLGRHLVKLLKELPDETVQFRKAVSLIVEGAIFCVSELDPQRWGFRSYLFAGTTTSKLSTLKDQIRDLYPSLILTQLEKRLPKPCQSFKAEYPEHAVGREQLIGDILGIIQQTPQKEQAILLHGIGGIGKTTIGDAVCAKISATNKSTKIVRVEVGEISGKVSLLDCQIDMCNQISREQHKIEDTTSGQYLLESILKECRLPVLIFIDNLFRVKDFEALFPKKLTLPNSCFILTTARDEAVSRKFKDSGILHKSYNVLGLKPSEATTVFNLHLDGPCPKGMEQCFNDILKLCNGWPLALTIVGSYLRGESNHPEKWITTKRKLELCKSVRGDTDDRLERILEWSYSQLDENCQKVFLDICCLMRNRDWEWVKALDPGYVEHLESLSLIKKEERLSWDEMFNYFEQARVQVHDLFAALGEKKSSSRICHRYEDVMQDNCDEDIYECEHVEGLVWSEGIAPLSGKKLDAMHKTLRILVLGWGALKVNEQCSKTPSKLQICSVEKLPFKDISRLHDLRVLRIAQPPYGDANDAVDYSVQLLPSNLHILELERVSSLQHFDEKAFKNCKSLHTVRIIACRNLEKLPATFCDCPIRVLHISYNRKLRSLPRGFNGLHSLEAFCFTDTFVGDEWELARHYEYEEEKRYHEEEYGHGVEESKSELEDSKYSEAESESFAKNVSKLKSGKDAKSAESDSIPEFDKGAGMVDDKNADDEVAGGEENFNPGTCTSQPGWYSKEEKGKPGSKKIVKAAHTVNGERDEESNNEEDLSHLQVVESVDFSQMSRLEYLWLDCQRTIKGTEQLHHGFGKLASLRTLRISSWTKLQQFTDDFSQLTALNHLDLSGCQSLTQLPEGVEKLTALNKLDLSGCKSLTQLPKGVEKLTALNQLDLSGCKSLTQLPEGVEKLTALNQLDLSGCKSLTQLPNGLENLHALSKLNLKGCSSLPNLPNVFSQSLEKLDLEACESVTDISGGFGNLLKLLELNLDGMKKLKQWPDGVSQLTLLQSLTLQGCQSVAAFENFSGLKSLTTLTLTACEEVPEFPEGLGQLRSLTDLKVDECHNLGHLPDDFTLLTSLRRLFMTSCEALEKLPSKFGNLLNLESLELTSCKKLKELPDSICELQKLQEIYLPDCCLEFLPKDFGNLSALRRLYLTGCSTLRALPDSIIGMKLKIIGFVPSKEVLESDVYKQVKANPGVEFSDY